MSQLPISGKPHRRNLIIDIIALAAGTWLYRQRRQADNGFTIPTIILVLKNFVPLA